MRPGEAGRSGAGLVFQAGLAGSVVQRGAGIFLLAAVEQLVGHLQQFAHDAAPGHGMAEQGLALVGKAATVHGVGHGGGERLAQAAGP